MWPVNTLTLPVLIWTKTFGSHLTAKLNCGYCRPAYNQVETFEFTAMHDVILISLRIYVCIKYVHIHARIDAKHLHLCEHKHVRIYCIYICMNVKM
jgi:hypothetical protein